MIKPQNHRTTERLGGRNPAGGEVNPSFGGEQMETHRGKAAGLRSNYETLAEL